MALSSAVIEQGTSSVFSYISTNVEDKASWADNIARLEIALTRMDIALEKTARIPITSIALLRTWKLIKGAYMEGIELLNKHKPQEENHGQVVVRRSSYLQRFAVMAGNLSISSLVGLGKEEKLDSSVAQRFERYADLAKELVAEVVSAGCLLRQLDTSRYPFLRHLFEGKTVRCRIVKNPSQSLSFTLHPVILEGRGVEVQLYYYYKDLRKLEECFYLILNLRISEDTDIIGISVKCMQWLTSQFKLVAGPAIGEFTLLPNFQDILHSSVPPRSFRNDVYVLHTKWWRPDPVCCNGNNYKSSLVVPDPVISIYFRCYISAPENNLRNAPLSLRGCFWPHWPSHYFSPERTAVKYGGKSEDRNSSLQQLQEIARSEGVDYLVHEPEPTDYVLHWNSPHGSAIVTLWQDVPRPSRRRVLKRKR